MTLKRTFDFTAAFFGLIILSPLMLATALMVRLLDGSPVLFKQERVGRGRRPFKILKFRTMKVNSTGPMITPTSDSRITRTGRFLRRSKLDELPQLINVLKGEMSFVGPRPEVPKYVEHYRPEDMWVLDFRPGITDAASLLYYNEGEILNAQADPEQYYLDVVMPHKLAIKKRYAARAGFIWDIRMIFMTVLHGFGFRFRSLDQFAGRDGGVK